MAQPTKMVIINASPKGEYSLTLQYARYLMMHEKDVVWEVLHVGEELTDTDFDHTWFHASLDLIEQCEAVLWATPVYTMLVPYQLLRFLQLIEQEGRASLFVGKYATSIMSCFHYYDHLAQHWLQATCEDLGMHFMEGLSVDDKDLMNPTYRQSLRFFMEEFHHTCLHRLPVIRQSKDLVEDFVPFKPQPSASQGEKRGDLRTVLLTDEVGGEGNLSAMIKVFLAAYPNQVEVVDINTFPYEGACQGCLRCELVGECDRKDGFQAFYQNLVNSCDVLVHAMNLEGRYLKPVWKLFLDRTFSNGHRTSMMGKHTCYLVSGPLDQLPYVRQFLEGKDMVGRENSVGVISDDLCIDQQLEALIAETALRLDRSARAHFQKGANFLGIGGMKIFRDLIYGMRGVVRDDHRFYKQRKLYDFPQRRLGNQLFNLFMGFAFVLKPVRLEAYKRMKPLYIAKQKQLVDSGRL